MHWHSGTVHFHHKYLVLGFECIQSLYYEIQKHSKAEGPPLRFFRHYETSLFWLGETFVYSFSKHLQLFLNVCNKMDPLSDFRHYESVKKSHFCLISSFLSINISTKDLSQYYSIFGGGDPKIFCYSRIFDVIPEHYFVLQRKRRNHGR